MYDLMLKYCPVCGGEFRAEIQTCGTCEVTLLSGGEMQYHERNTMKPDYVCNDCGQEISPNEYDKLSETFCSECGGQIRENTEKNWCYSVATGDIIGPVYDSDIIKAYQEKIIDLETQIYHLGKYEWKPLKSLDLLNSVIKAVTPETEEPSRLVAEEDTETTLLVTCESCSNKISKKAEACPKCGWKPQVMCQICHQKIPFDITVCPECGDPRPFDLQELTKQTTYSPKDKKATGELGSKNSSPLVDESTTEQKKNQASRPGKVGTAVKLLYITLGIGVLRSIMEANMHAQMASPAFVMLVTFFGLVFMWFFIHMIGKGRNWARITFLLLFIAGIPVGILLLLQSLAANPISGLVSIGLTVIQIIALVFLFQNSSSNWFREMKANR